MAIKYTATKVLRTHDKQPTYYARAAYDGETSLDDIARMIEEISAISEGDVLSVLRTLGNIAARELARGRILDLGDLGRMRLSLRAKSVPTPEEVTTSTIQGSRVIFVPGHAIKHTQRNLRFAFTSEGAQPRKPEDTPAPDEPITPAPTPGGQDQDDDAVGV